MKKHKFIPLAGISVTILIVLLVFQIFSYHKLSRADEIIIAETVNSYYKSLESKQFEQALSYCLIETNNDDVYMDTETRVVLLKEVWEKIYHTFKTSNACENIQYDKSEKSYYVSMSYTLKYKNTVGGLTKDILYVRKVADNWRIFKIRSLDRYIFLRAGQYKVERTVEFLKPSKDIKE